MSNNGFDAPGMKPHLTPTEKLSAAYFHLVMGVDQHQIAAMYRVNQGRVSEAVSAARTALGVVDPPMSQSDMQILKAIDDRPRRD